MTFDLHIHIDDQSPESYVLESIISRDNVSAEDAVRTALRGMAIERRPGWPASNEVEKKAGALLFGIFADEPKLMQRIAKDARDARDREIVLRS
jgi:hypothetical protein